MRFALSGWDASKLELSLKLVSDWDTYPWAVENGRALANLFTTAALFKVAAWATGHRTPAFIPCHTLALIAYPLMDATIKLGRCLFEPDF